MRRRNLVQMIALAMSFLIWLIASPCLADSSIDTATSSVSVEQIQGEKIFEIHCAGCHPNGGNIIRRGKSLKIKALKRNRMDSIDAIAHTVTIGKSPMSAYADTLSADEIQTVSAYVLAQAEHGWQ